MSQEERALRFLEEALELAQACDISQGKALEMVDYVFARPRGSRWQEIGGVTVCLSALCSAIHFDLQDAADDELRRCELNTDKIREKHAAKDQKVRAILNG